MSMLSIFSKILPEGIFKESLRKICFMHVYNLFVLNKLIRKAKFLQNGMLFLELNNGLKFYTRWSFEILREQFILNMYEKHYKLKKDDFVVDIGAYVGVFTVKAAKTVGNNGTVVAIEPEENNLKLLKRNIKINKLSNVILVPKGLWSKKDKLRLYLRCRLSSPAAHSLVHKTAKFKEIEVDTLDNILKEIRLGRVDFIKMDIEGAEIEALKGAEETLRNNAVRLAIGAYHKVGGAPTYEVIAPQLERMGFKAIEEDGIVYAEK